MAHPHIDRRSTSPVPPPTFHPGTLSTADDAALLRAAGGGDEAAWRELISRYAALVYSIPARSGLPDDQRDDVFQEVFAALLKQADSIRDARSLPKWFITTAHRATWRMICNARPPGAAGAAGAAANHVAINGQVMSPDEPPPELAARWERQYLLRRALARLSADGHERCAELIAALFLRQSEPDYQEIARELDMPIGSIGPTRGRCMRKLLNILTDMGFE